MTRTWAPADALHHRSAEGSCWPRRRSGGGGSTDHSVRAGGAAAMAGSGPQSLAEGADAAWLLWPASPLIQPDSGWKVPPAAASTRRRISAVVSPPERRCSIKARAGAGTELGATASSGWARLRYWCSNNGAERDTVTGIWRTNVPYDGGSPIVVGSSASGRIRAGWRHSTG
ncbi:hypothetical protein SMALB_3520 [Streptomyces malaysiensis]|uniref:Uncharacterized protein n=1 Tax=Streptomyces malaysiensis TaxID=92644 RepID=A0A7X5X2M5_STRMQ|nr:hypothetical protein [Streptomyces malaysiensis]